MTTLADLDAMDRLGLAGLWSNLIGGAVPAFMSQPMQRRFLAFELQAKAEGGLPAALRARLDRIAAGEERRASPTLQPGARLLREWNGTTHVVDVLPDGFLWNGASHRSLSAIARAITGARWSGPRFFGLVSAASEDPGKSVESKARGRQKQSLLPSKPKRERAA
jgi:Protein of unknown function (DUF2924)